ncbi:hypothetical protein A4G99_20460 [Haladaptatus sp. R4]|uniref:DUF2182 domain-containing protein n=1 Tax=Haladaptatus sp. R4 TaxID=1679489 RepID=UPI0007B4DA1E|nr:DUF2182 domain-containing protein [Haladaptatus sp. R4]KZN26432.1 hypothetical protein A4G99_20460 [Haladaptatus sp. R4]
MSIDTKSIPLTRLDRSLDRTTAVVVSMVVLDVLWWTLIYTGRVPMPGMMWLMKSGIPMAAPGAMEAAVSHAGTLGAVLGYVVMWGVMMWAMMFPPMTRFTRDYADALDGRVGTVTATVAAFLTAYNVVWALSATIPLAVQAIIPGGIYGFTETHTTFVIGSVLVLTGCYQQTAFKRSRLRTCCSRVAPHEANVARGFRTGLKHGVSCILVCLGPFFLLMPFFGEMNFFWMVALTTVVTVERLPASWGREFSTATGIVALVAGLLVLFLRPSLPIVFSM